MNKNYLCRLLCIFLLLHSFKLSAQDNIVSKKEFNKKIYNLPQQQQDNTIIRCYTFEKMKLFQKKHPNAVTTQQFENFLKQKIEARKNAKTLEQDYTIPVIFHIIHNGENVGTGSNISIARINAQLNQLNIDYANLAGTTWPEANTAADTRIQFCLATVDPYGVALPDAGINRINRNTAGFNAPPYTNTDYVDNTIKVATIWDPNKYFNVWVMNLGNSLLGYATFPSFSTLPGLEDYETDFTAGVVIHHGSVGSVNTPGTLAPYNLGRTLTHEAGHFFGLRHIWGDHLDEQNNQVQCGADFCNDTPTQQDETGGCPPLNPRPTSCNNTGNMFENYMDYSSDACLNTFTNDQKNRMQTVMENSPRRLSLATSQVCTANPVNNSVAFTSFATAITETGNQGTCPKYKEFNLTLKISGAATGDAAVTFTQINGSTAILGKDYTITPNIVNYTNGDAADKIVTVRILEDAIVEGNEIANIGFNIAGTGVVHGFANQTHAVNILDDDKNPVISHLPITILDEDFGTLNNPPDLSGWVTGAFGGDGGINKWTVSENGGVGVDGLCAHITNDLNASPNTYSKITNGDVLLITPLLNTSGEYKNFTLTFKYKSNGEKVGNTFTDYGRVTYSLNGNTFTTLIKDGVQVRLQGVTDMTEISIPLPANVDNQPFYIGFRWTNNNMNGQDPGFTFDDVQILAAQARNVETEAGENKVTTVNSGEEVYFKSDVDGDVIAKIKNASADIGCVSAGLSTVGNGLIDINTSGGTFKRTQKVFQISPEVANNNVTYEGTLYFTKAELDIWDPIKLDLKILKVKDGVDLNGIIGAGDVEIVTPTSVTDFPNNGYTTYTADFTGFSQFMLAEPSIVLSIQLLTFKAKALTNSIQLDWATAFENNNKGFKIERSEDGNTFSEIGWVEGKGNSTQEEKYRYEDKQVKVNITYYYRLRQINVDATEKLSDIRTAKIGRDEIVVQARPNPTAGMVKLQILTSANVADIEVYNAKGQRVISKPKVALNGQLVELNLSAYASGVYTIVVNTNNHKISTAIIKQ